MKKIVSYISFSGKTKRIAEEISNKINCELLEIKPLIPYTNEDLNWMDKTSRSTLEMQDEKSRPEIENMDIILKYDIIFIGYPIWWGTFPREINTLIDNYDLSNKIIVPFATSGGSNINKSIEDLKKYLPNSKILDGYLINNIDEVEAIINKLNI